VGLIEGQTAEEEGCWRNSDAEMSAIDVSDPTVIDLTVVPSVSVNGRSKLSNESRQLQLVVDGFESSLALQFL